MISPETTRRREDPRNLAILAERVAKLDAREGPRVGDWVRFADGTERRISHIWRDGTDWDGGAQTADGTGSFYLGEHGCSYSGALHPPVPLASLTLVNEVSTVGLVWIFDHDHARAGGGVTFEVPFRVYTCDREAPR